MYVREKEKVESVEERQGPGRRVRFTGVFRCVSHKCQLRETNTRKSFYTKSLENLGAYGIYYARIFFRFLHGILYPTSAAQIAEKELCLLNCFS